MTEEAQTQPDSTPAPASTEQTLDDVYKEYNVNIEQPQAQPQPQQPQTPQRQGPTIPDPALDPQGYRDYETARYNESEQIKQVLHTVAGRLTNYEQSQVRAKEEADIKAAVDAVKQKVDADPDFLEISIAHRAKKDPKFMQLWSNRGKNPQAWNAGLKALANELGEKFSMRADPQLAENLRAAKQSQQSQAVGTPEEDETAKLGKLQGKDFDKALNKYRRRA